MPAVASRASSVRLSRRASFYLKHESDWLKLSTLRPSGAAYSVTGPALKSGSPFVGSVIAKGLLGPARKLLLNVVSHWTSYSMIMFT